MINNRVKYYLDLIKEKDHIGELIYDYFKEELDSKKYIIQDYFLDDNSITLVSEEKIPTQILNNICKGKNIILYDNYKTMYGYLYEFCLKEG